MQVEKVVTLQMSLFLLQKHVTKIKLQGILDKTTERLVEAQCEVLKNVPFLSHLHYLANRDVLGALFTALINRYLKTSMLLMSFCLYLRLFH